MENLNEKKGRLGKELLIALKNAVNGLIDARAEELIEEHQEDYSMGYDKDFVDVGVGPVCVRCEEIFDEERAWGDAEEEIINDIERNDNDACFYLFEDDDFRNSLVAFLRGTE